MGLLYLDTYIQQECALNGKLQNKLIDCLWQMDNKVVQSGNKARNTAGCRVLTELVWVQFGSWKMFFMINKPFIINHGCFVLWGMIWGIIRFYLISDPHFQNHFYNLCDRETHRHACSPKDFSISTDICKSYLNNVKSQRVCPARWAGCKIWAQHWTMIWGAVLKTKLVLAA